jgi:hypothetical protein
VGPSTPTKYAININSSLFDDRFGPVQHILIYVRRGKKSFTF